MINTPSFCAARRGQSSEPSKQRPSNGLSLAKIASLRKNTQTACQTELKFISGLKYQRNNGTGEILVAARDRRNAYKDGNPSSLLKK
jgi:hypothetical protein